MGRTVSHATGASWVFYVHLDHDEGRIFECRKCGHEHERDDDTEPAECEDCGNVGFTSFDRTDARDAWDDFVGNLRASFKAAFPSLDDCDEWLGREDHAILSNRHAWIGVSEYCGLVSVWCKPRDEPKFYSDDPEPAFSRRWAEQIERRAQQCLDGFTRLVKIGTFSNGEAIYRRAA